MFMVFVHTLAPSSFWLQPLGPGNFYTFRLFFLFHAIPNLSLNSVLQLFNDYLQQMHTLSHPSHVEMTKLLATTSFVCIWLGLTTIIG